MKIVLLILKIIGIILLWILGAVVALLALILFAPIFYRGKLVKNEESFFATFKASFLGLINFKFIYKDKVNLSLKICGFELLKDKKDNQQHKDKKIKNKKIKEEKAKEDNTKDKKTKNENTKGDNTINEKKEMLAEVNNENISDVDEQANSENITETDKGFKKKVREFVFKIKDIYDKIKKLFMRIKDDVTVLTSEPIISFVKLCKDQLLYLLKKILPRVIRGELHYSLGSPDNTAYVYAGYAGISSLTRWKINVYPDFESEETAINADIWLKGHFNLWIVILAALKIYFDKNFKVFMKEIKNL